MSYHNLLCALTAALILYGMSFLEATKGGDSELYGLRIQTKKKLFYKKMRQYKITVILEVGVTGVVSSFSDTLYTCNKIN